MKLMDPTAVADSLETIQKGMQAFKQLAEAAAAGEDVAGKVKQVLDQAALKRESLHRPGQRRRGPNFTAPGSTAKQRKAKRRAQGQARHK